MPIPPPPPFNRVFCPINPQGLDRTIETGIDSAGNLPGVYRNLITGDNGGLIHLAQRATLYLIAHGSSTEPVFMVGERKWTPKEMVNALECAGLKKDHRQIVLLVCNAGNTLGTEAEMAYFAAKRKEHEKLRKEAEKFKVFADPEKIEAELRAFKNFNKDASAISPKNWAKTQENMGEGFPDIYAGARFIVPLAGQFVDELKRRKYTQIRVRSFTGAVSNIFTHGIMIENTHWDAESINADTGKPGIYRKVSSVASRENTVEWL